MEEQEFANIVNDLQVTQRQNANKSVSLTLVKPDLKYGLSAAGKPNVNAIQRNQDYIDTYNKLVFAVAKHLGYYGAIDKYLATSVADVKRHVVVEQYDPDSKRIVYIRTTRGYNNHGSKNRNRSDRTKGANTHMKNRKVTLTLFPLISGLALTLQITGSGKDATAWTKFCDPDLSKPEYDNPVWTKDVESANKDAVKAIDEMIQIQLDLNEGKIEESAAAEQLKNKYIEWVVAHLSTNPEFVERRIPGLNCEGNLMAAYLEPEADQQ